MDSLIRRQLEDPGQWVKPCLRHRTGQGSSIQGLREGPGQPKQWRPGESQPALCLQPQDCLSPPLGQHTLGKRYRHDTTLSPNKTVKVPSQKTTPCSKPPRTGQSRSARPSDGSHRPKPRAKEASKSHGTRRGPQGRELPVPLPPKQASPRSSGFTSCQVQISVKIFGLLDSLSLI